jgi:excisionase family DNA binding protein
MPDALDGLALATERRTAPMSRAYYSPREAEAILGVSHATLYRLLAAGRLEARKLGVKTLISAESIAGLIAGMPRATFGGAAPGRTVAR